MKHKVASLALFSNKEPHDKFEDWLGLLNHLILREMTKAKYSHLQYRIL